MARQAGREGARHGGRGVGEQGPHDHRPAPDGVGERAVEDAHRR